MRKSVQADRSGLLLVVLTITSERKGARASTLASELTTRTVLPGCHHAGCTTFGGLCQAVIKANIEAIVRSASGETIVAQSALFTPFRVQKLDLANRIVIAPMCWPMLAEDGWRPTGTSSISATWRSRARRC